MGKNSTVIYHSYMKRFEKLSDAQFGQIIKAALTYEQSGDIPEIDDPAVAMAFDFIKFDIDENKRSYERISEERAKAGAKGGKKSKRSKEKQNKHLLNNEANQADKDSDSVSDIEEQDTSTTDAREKEDVDVDNVDIVENTPSDAVRRKYIAHFREPPSGDLQTLADLESVYGTMNVYRAIDITGKQSPREPIAYIRTVLADWEKTGQLDGKVQFRSAAGGG